MRRQRLQTSAACAVCARKSARRSPSSTCNPDACSLRTDNRMYDPCARKFCGDEDRRRGQNARRTRRTRTAARSCKNCALLARRKKRNSQMRDRIMFAQLRRRFVRLVTLIARMNNFGRRLSMRARFVARRLQQSAKHLKQSIDNFDQKQPEKCSLTFRHCVHSYRLPRRFCSKQFLPR